MDDTYVWIIWHLLWHTKKSLTFLLTCILTYIRKWILTFILTHILKCSFIVILTEKLTCSPANFLWHLSLSWPALWHIYPDFFGSDVYSGTFSDMHPDNLWHTFWQVPIKQIACGVSDLGPGAPQAIHSIGKARFSRIIELGMIWQG